MSSDAGDESPSPEPGFEQDSSIMAEDKTSQASSDDKSPGKGSNNSKPTTKTNSKDPGRPRRKKARRACYACQRAHLTCGDERPCLRCVKRGLQDQCQDGVRKKAKYLHDAPNEALLPGFATNYHLNGSHNMQVVPGAPPMGPNAMAVSQPGNYFASNPSAGYPQYIPVNQRGQMAPPMMDNPNLGGFGTHPSVESPTEFQQLSNQQVSPMQDLSVTLDPSSTLGSGGAGSFDSSFIDPNDPSLFNFNISDLNFGNHYGALEFGMLGHMATGAVNTPDADVVNVSQPNQGSISYDGPTGFPSNFGYNDQFQPWQNITDARVGSTTNLWALQNSGLDAFAVGENTSTLTGTSPHSQNQEHSAGYQSQTVSPEAHFAQPDQNQHPQSPQQHMSHARQHARNTVPFPDDVHQPVPKRRRRDPSAIYASVQSPYPYTQAFHTLTGLLQRRYPSKKVLKIAKALASIRPSFISCNQNLTQEDLIFMEKGFQRSLYEQDGFFNAVGTPSVVIRRTGEIAAINKEFSLVTGWRQDVLLGREPNLNVNMGGNSSASETGYNTRGTGTPRVPNMESDLGHPQAVFLAELMDEDSVVQFYEHFSELAYGAPHESKIGIPCSLLKYKTKDDPGWGPEDRFKEDGVHVKKQAGIKTEQLMKGEAGMNALGEKDGRVNCMMCWMIKRDMFDMPQLIVMNFLPII